MYEEYMQNYLGYPRQSGYQNTYDQMLENYPYSQVNYNGYPQYYNMQNRGNMAIENMEEYYPEIYRIVYPMVRKVCARNNRVINKDEIDSMVDEVYRNVEADDGVKINITLNNDVRGEEKSENREEENRQIRRRNNMLNDLIRILILRELIGRPGCFGPNCPRPGMPPRPQPRPPFPRYDFNM